MTKASTEPLTSPWQLKPWWCQPWSILLTGLSLICGSWYLGHRWWLTALVAAPVCLWMGYFVLLWPRLVVEAGWLEQASTLADLPSKADQAPNP